jgi:hypothetical protein
MAATKWRHPDALKNRQRWRQAVLALRNRARLELYPYLFGVIALMDRSQAAVSGAVERRSLAEVLGALGRTGWKLTVFAGRASWVMAAALTAVIRANQLEVLPMTAIAVVEYLWIQWPYWVVMSTEHAQAIWDGVRSSLLENVPVWRLYSHLLWGAIKRKAAGGNS